MAFDPYAEEYKLQDIFKGLVEAGDLEAMRLHWNTFGMRSSSYRNYDELHHAVVKRKDLEMIKLLLQLYGSSNLPNTRKEFILHMSWDILYSSDCDKKFIQEFITTFEADIGDNDVVQDLIRSDLIR